MNLKQWLQKLNVKKIHYISGLILSVFIFFHLGNQLLSLFGPSVHREWMNQFRKVYRQPVFEFILLSAVFFQVITGIKLLFNRRKKTGAEKAQLYSGLYLSVFLVVHVGAVMFGRQIQLDTNFYFAAAGMNLSPAIFVFIPYYFLAVTAITVHVASLHYLKTKSKTVSYGIAIIGILAAALIILGYTNSFEWRVMPAEYQHFIRMFFG